MKRLYNTLFIITFSCVSTVAFGMNEQPDNQTPTDDTTKVADISLTTSEINTNPPTTQQPTASLISSSYSQPDGISPQKVLKSLSNFTNQITPQQRIATGASLFVAFFAWLLYFVTTNAPV